MLPPRRYLLLAVVTLALLLPAAGKKGKKRKPSFLEDDKKRNAYVDYLFERYDGNKDPALNEAEVDEANERPSGVERREVYAGDALSWSMTGCVISEKSEVPSMPRMAQMSAPSGWSMYGHELLALALGLGEVMSTQ